MSHIAEIESDIRDLECLQSALGRLGLTLGGAGKVRFYSGSQNADHVVTFPGSYDLGFAVKNDGYKLVGDGELFRRGRNGRNDRVFDVLGESLDHLFEEYSYSVLEKQANLNGRSISRNTLEDGTVEVLLESHV